MVQLNDYRTDGAWRASDCVQAVCLGNDYNYQKIHRQKEEGIVERIGSKKTGLNKNHGDFAGGSYAVYFYFCVS